MNINFIACLFIILCAPVLIISSLPIQNKLSSSTQRFLDLLDDHQVNATGGATVIHSHEDDGSDARTAYAVLKFEIVNSKKSQGKRGAGGGNNVVREPKPAKSNALPLLQILKSFYFSVYISFSLFIVLSF